MPRTIAYLRVSTPDQDIEKNKADLLRLANDKELGTVRFVQEQASGLGNHRYMLLLLAALDQWFRIFIQGGASPPSWKWSDCF